MSFCLLCNHFLSTGEYSTDQGAPPPCIVHSRPNAKKKDTILRPILSDYANLIAEKEYQDSESTDVVYHGGMKLWVTKNGSMEKAIFPELCDHILQNLPSGIGRKTDGLLPLLFFVDGHSSRWDYPALFRLFSAGVFTFVLPSHTSIWSQPNDNGQNRKLHGEIRRETDAWKASPESEECKRFQKQDWNLIFRRAWENFVMNEEIELKNDGENTTTRAWKKTGLHPYDELADAWLDAVFSIGWCQLEEEGAVNRRAPSFYAEPKMRNLSLDDEDREMFLIAIGDEGLASCEAAVGGKQTLDALICQKISNFMLCRYRDSLDSTDPLKQPMPTNKAEEILLQKYYTFKHSGECDLFRAPANSEDELKQRRREQMVTLSRSLDALYAKRLRDECSGVATKNGDEWFVLWKDQGVKPSIYTDSQMIALTEEFDLDVGERSGKEAKRAIKASEEMARKFRVNAARRQLELAKKKIEQERSDKIQELRNNIVEAAGRRDSDDDDLSDEVNQAFAEFQEYVSKPIKRTYHGFRVVAGEGETRAAPILANQLLGDAMKRVQKLTSFDRKTKRKKSSGKDSSAFGVDPIEILARYLNGINEEADEKIDMLNPESAEEVREIIARLDNLCISFSAHPSNFWSVEAVGYSAAELKDFAWLMECTVKSTGKNKAPLKDDYRRSLAKMCLTKKDVVAKIDALRRKLNSILHIDDERFDELTQGMTFDDIFHRIEIFSEKQLIFAAGFSTMQQVRDTEMEEDVRRQVERLGEALDDLLDLKILHDRHSTSWWCGREDDDEDDDSVEDENSDDERLWEVFGRLYQKVDEKEYDLVERNEYNTKRLLIEKLDFLESFLCRYHSDGEDVVLKYCGGLLDSFRPNSDQLKYATSDCAGNGASVDEANDTVVTTATAADDKKVEGQRPCLPESDGKVKPSAPELMPGVVAFSNNSAYQSAAGSTAGDGRCGCRAVVQCLYYLLGEEKFLDHFRHRRVVIPPPPSYDFAWSTDQAMLKWLDDFSYQCALEYYSTIHGQSVESRVSTLQPTDPYRLMVESHRLDDYASERSDIGKQDAKIDPEGWMKWKKVHLTKPHTGPALTISERWMDQRLAIGVGSLLDVNIITVACDSGYRTEVFPFASSGITTSLNYFPRLHYDIQGQLPPELPHLNPPDTGESEDNFSNHSINMSPKNDGEASPVHLSKNAKVGDENRSDLSPSRKQKSPLKRGMGEAKKILKTPITKLMKRRLGSPSLPTSPGAQRNSLTIPLPIESPDKLAAIAKAVTKGPGDKDSDIIVTSTKDSVRRKSMQRLRHGNDLKAKEKWLNDEVVNYYMLTLRDREKMRAEVDPEFKRCHFFSSFFINELGVGKKYKYSKVRRWTQKLGDIFDMDKVFVPINIGNSHWTVAVIDMTNKRIEYFDSKHDPGKKYVEALFQYLKDEHQRKKGEPLPDEKNWELLDHIKDCPYQSNKYDCGVFVCLLCDFYSSGLPLTYAEADMDRWRDFIVLAMLDFDEKQSRLQESLENSDPSNSIKSKSDGDTPELPGRNRASVNSPVKRKSSRGRLIKKKEQYDA